jgi:tetratricopeptide (TPR) repeat protein
MGKDPQPVPEATSKASLYFISGSVCLFLMAFLWSLDISFIYIFLGGAVFFFFLGIRSKIAAQPKGQRFGDRVRETYKTASPQQAETTGLSDFEELLKQAQERSRQAASTGSSPVNPAGKKIVLGVLFFIASIFFMIIVAVFSLGSDDEIPQEEYAVGTMPTDFDVAEDFYRNAQYDSAYIYYKRALRENPDDAAAMVGYGSVLYTREYPDSTLMMYDQALAADPDYDFARYNKAWVYNDRNNYPQALTEIQTLIKRNPSYNEAYSLQGDIYYNQADYQQALLSYETAYNNGVRNNGLCKIMADLYVRQGEGQKAIALYQEALTYDTTDVYSYRKLGELIPGEEGNYYRTRALQQP